MYHAKKNNKNFVNFKKIKKINVFIINHQE